MGAPMATVVHCVESATPSVNYVRSGKVCMECWPSGLNVSMLSMIVMALLVGLTYIAAFQSFEESPRKVILRILLTYIQMLSSLGLFQAQATRTFREIFGVSETIGGSFVSAPPLQCVLRLSYYMRFGFNMGLPFMMVPLSVVFAGTVMLCRSCFSKCRSTRKRSQALNHQVRGVLASPRSYQFHRGCWKEFKEYIATKAYLSPMVFVMFLSYNMLSTTAATMFQCRPEVIDNQQYLTTDLAVQCYNSQHVAGMLAAGTMALLFNLGLPLLLIVFLRKHRQHLQREDVFRRFGFLYQGYSVSRGRYAWEAVVLLRKFIVIMVASTIEDPWYQAVAGISVVFMAFALHLAYRPYDNALYNRLEVAVLSVLVATQVISLIYLRSETVPMLEEDRKRVDVIVTFILVALNAAMFATIIGVLGKNIRCFQRCCCRKKAAAQALVRSTVREFGETRSIAPVRGPNMPDESLELWMTKVKAGNFQAWTHNPLSVEFQTTHGPDVGITER